jgi:hypothetical protein
MTTRISESIAPNDSQRAENICPPTRDLLPWPDTACAKNVKAGIAETLDSLQGR